MNPIVSEEAFEAHEQSVYSSFRYFVVCLCAIVTWEFFNSIPGEIRMYQSKFSPTTIFFATCRYLVIIGLAFIMHDLFEFTPNIDCSAWVYIPPLMYAVVQTSASAIFVIRVILVWNKSRMITVALITLLFAMFATNVGVAFLQRPANVQGFCAPISRSIASSTSFFVAVFVDLIILGLSVIQLWTNAFFKQSQMWLSKLLLRDGLIYFLIAMIVNVLTALCIIINRNDSAIEGYLQPAAFVFPSIMAQRMVINLKTTFSDGVAAAPKANIARQVAV